MRAAAPRLMRLASEEEDAERIVRDYLLLIEGASGSRLGRPFPHYHVDHMRPLEVG